MSTLSDGLASVNNLTAQINALKEQQNAAGPSTAVTTDPKTALYQIEASFNQMLNSLLTTSSDSNDEEKKDNNDLFSSFYQNSTSSTLTSSGINVSPYTGTLTGLTDQGTNQYNLLQAQLNLTKQISI